jgi:hypothetical protein
MICKNYADFFVNQVGSGLASGSGSTTLLKQQRGINMNSSFSQNNLTVGYLDPGSVREVNILGSVTPNPLVRTVGEENLH